MNSPTGCTTFCDKIKLDKYKLDKYMKTLLLAGAAIALTACSANGAPAKIMIDLPKDALNKQLVVKYAPVNAPQSAAKTDTVSIDKTSLTINVPEDGEAYAYNIRMGEDMVDNIFVAPSETVNISISSLSPFDYTISGTALVEGIRNYEKIIAPISEAFMAARESGAPGPEMERIYNRYIDATKKFIDDNPTSPASVMALMSLGGEDYLDYFDKLSSQIEGSMFAQAAKQQKEGIAKQVEATKRQQAMAAGTTPAPAFTLKDLEGKDVSLSQFKGKWVVLDFWGSWCIWCIKGFPELKENYARYAGKLEVIGVDCGDTPDKWKAAVAKFELPWINVYNPQGENSVDRLYEVQGFPTKVIVNPEGNIVDITTGEDPSFYERLANFISK